MSLTNDLTAILNACVTALPIDGASHSALRVKTLADFLAKALHNEVDDTLLVAVQDLVPYKDTGRRLGFGAPLADRQAQLETELASWAKRCASGEYKARPGFLKA